MIGYALKNDVLLLILPCSDTTLACTVGSEAIGRQLNPLESQTLPANPSRACGDPQFDRYAEVLTLLPRNKIAPSDADHGRGPVEIDLASAGDRVRWVAKIIHPAQREALIPRNRGRRGNRIARVHQHSRANMETFRPRENVVMRLQ